MRAASVARRAVLAGGLCLAGASLAWGEGKQQPQKRVRWKDTPSVTSKEYRRFDKNGDGKLDEAEKAAIRETFKLNPKDAYLAPYDRDDDKALTDREIAGIPPKETDLKALEKMQQGQPQKAAKKKKK